METQMEPTEEVVEAAVDEAEQKSPLEEARENLEVAERRAKTWTELFEKHTQELEELEAQEQDINPEDSKAAEKELAKVGRRISEKRELVETARKVADSSRKRMAEAEKAVKVAEADELDARARELRERSAHHRGKTDHLLEQLRAHEGCEYVPKPPPSSAEVAMAGAAGIVYQVPKPDRIIDEAIGLENRAATFRASLVVRPDSAGEERRRWTELERMSLVRAATEAVEDARRQGLEKVIVTPGGQPFDTSKSVEEQPDQLREYLEFEAQMRDSA